jgi:hypothetical protein
MTILHAAASGEFFNAVRLLGVGTTGARFVQRFHANVPAAGTPLAQLSKETPGFIRIAQGEGDALLNAADLADSRSERYATTALKRLASSVTARVLR